MINLPGSTNRNFHRVLFIGCVLLASTIAVGTACMSQPGNDNGSIGRTIYLKPKGEYANIDTREVIKLDDILLRGTPAEKNQAIATVLAKPDRYPPPVLYCTSKALMDQGKKDQAVFWFCAGQLRCRYDAARCADVSARAATGALNMQFSPFIVPYLREIKPKIETIVQQVVEWDRKTPYNYDHRWINLHGLAALSFPGEKTSTTSQPLSLPQSEWGAIREKTRVSFVEYWHKVVTGPKTINPADVNSTDEQGRTALMLAAMKGDVNTAKALLSKGANVNTVDASNYTALIYALGRVQRDGIVMHPVREISLSPEQKELAELLVDKGADPNFVARDGYAPLSLAALAGDATLVQKLLEAGAKANPEAAGRNIALPMTEGARSGNVDVIRLLIKAGSNVNPAMRTYDGNTPLMCAIENDKVDAVKLLIASGAQVEVSRPDGTTAVMLAAGAAYAGELLQALLQAGAKASGEGSYGQTAISNAASRGTIETVKMLIAHDAKIDPKGKSGQRALWEAVLGKNPTLVKFFIEQGVDVNLTTPRGNSLLQEAADGGNRIMTGSADVVRLLLDAGAKPNDSHGDRGTPLIAAAEKRNSGIVRLLLQRGADVNALSGSGRSALIGAVAGPFIDPSIVKMLLESDADTSVREQWSGKTALAYTEGRTDPGAAEAAALLREHGAR